MKDESLVNFSFDFSVYFHMNTIYTSSTIEVYSAEATHRMKEHGRVCLLSDATRVRVWVDRDGCGSVIGSRVWPSGGPRLINYCFINFIWVLNQFYQIKKHLNITYLLMLKNILIHRFFNITLILEMLTLLHYLMPLKWVYI